MVVDTKLYDLLGVSPSCSENELKRAFKKKAFELHPDRNKEDPQATEKFQAVNEAYEILKDPQKRQQYDQFGMDALKEGMGQGGANIFDFFFGRHGQGKSRKPRTQDIGHELKVSLEDLYNGKESTLKINRNIICPDCKGN
jgi:DnaJ-class molecular chaperone